MKSIVIEAYGDVNELKLVEGPTCFSEPVPLSS